MDTVRFDLSSFKATRTDEGYLVDTPIVGRTGIQVYKRADGTLRRELRLPEEIFQEDSLSSFIGKPVTFGHPTARVTSKNAKELSIGFIRDKGFPDGGNLRAPIVVHDSDSIDKACNGGICELSLGYTVDLEEVSGIWNGEHYDAIQRKPRINHLAIVPRGRAGNARLNLDRNDAISFFENEEPLDMTTKGDLPSSLERVRLDNGIDYHADPEVVHALKGFKKDAEDAVEASKELKKRLDAITAERDTLQSKVESAEKIREDAFAKAMVEVKERLALEAVAEKFKLDAKGKTNRQVKELVIKAIRSDADLPSKSDDYVNAAFDLTVALHEDKAIANQRLAGATRADSTVNEGVRNYRTFMNGLSTLSAKKE